MVNLRFFSTIWYRTDGLLVHPGRYAMKNNHQAIVTRQCLNELQAQNQKHKPVCTAEGRGTKTVIAFHEEALFHFSKPRAEFMGTGQDIYSIQGTWSTLVPW